MDETFSFQSHYSGPCISTQILRSPEDGGLLPPFSVSGAQASAFTKLNYRI